MGSKMIGTLDKDEPKIWWIVNDFLVEAEDQCLVERSICSQVWASWEYTKFLVPAGGHDLIDLSKVQHDPIPSKIHCHVSMQA